MKKLRLLALPSILLAAGACSGVGQDATSTSVAPQHPQQLSGHLTPAMRASPVVGRLPADQRMEVTIGLSTDMAKLDAAIDEVSDPKSHLYGHYLTPDEFADRFGATRSDYQEVLEWAVAHRLSFTPHPSRMLATLSGSVADIETAFHVRLNYALRPDGTQFHAPDVEPSLDLRVPVDHIGGLEDFARPKHAGGSGPGGSRQGTDFRNAYASCTAQTGAGQTIGLVIFGELYQPSDVAGYEQMTNMSFLPVQSVPANTGVGSNGAAEPTLDIEMAGSMAPGAQIVVFTGNNFDQIFANMAARTDIKQFSISYSFPGDSKAAALAGEMALQGQTVFIISGDSGAYTPTNGPGGESPANPTLDGREYPGVTIVGGTALNMADQGVLYWQTETAWTGSCGGILPNLPLPAYQQSIVGKNQASGSFRNAPDVAAEATSVNVYVNGGPGTFLGTSLASPLWAGFMALANEQRASYGEPSVGFANPVLYGLAASSLYADTFNDIVSGCNGTNNTYCAGTGYDLVTGLGSPKCGLIDALTVQAGVPAPPSSPPQDCSWTGSCDGSVSVTCDTPSGLILLVPIAGGDVSLLASASPSSSGVVTATSGTNVLPIDTQGSFEACAVSDGIPSCASTVLVKGAPFAGCAPGGGGGGTGGGGLGGGGGKPCGGRVCLQ